MPTKKKDLPEISPAESVDKPRFRTHPKQANIMTMKTLDQRSDLGMRCVQCGNRLITPEWSEYRDDRQIHHLWHCWKCGCHFETEIDPIEDIIDTV